MKQIKQIELRMKQKMRKYFPGPTADVDRGYEYVKTLKNDHLKEIISFYLFESLAGIGNKYKLFGKLENLMEEFDNFNAEMVSNEGNSEI